mgnify:CR=1 FL=1
MSARQETIDRYRHFRAIAKQHLGGALKHLSRTAIKEAAQLIRVALTGSNRSPDLHAIARTLGKDEVLRRVRALVG